MANRINRLALINVNIAAKALIGGMLPVNHHLKKRRENKNNVDMPKKAPKK